MPVTCKSKSIVRLGLLLAMVSIGEGHVAATAGGARLDHGAAILDVHNAERIRVGSPPLQWDPELAAAAQGYARRLAEGAPFAHSSRAERPRQRENLSRGLPGASTAYMLNLWTSEKSRFVPGVFPNVSTTGEWHDVAHYTQMIWKTTTHVGCGTASGTAGEFLVCRYSPPGNADGRQVP